MFKSLKSWMNIPYERRVFVKHDGTGTKVYEDDKVPGLCYPVGDNEEITDYRGALTTSSTKLYIPGTTIMEDLDTIIFEGREQTIHKVVTFYRDGKPDIKVVYL